LREVAELCVRKAHRAADFLSSGKEVLGLEMAFPERPFFKEFTLRCKSGADSAIARAHMAGIDIGPGLKQYGFSPASRFDECLLVAVTEKRTLPEMVKLVDALTGSSR
jgi:glycine cleavage system pyridoxal-binding protein P